MRWTGQMNDHSSIAFAGWREKLSWMFVWSPQCSSTFTTEANLLMNRPLRRRRNNEKIIVKLFYALCARIFKGYENWRIYGLLGLLLRTKREPSKVWPHSVEGKAWLKALGYFSRCFKPLATPKQRRAVEGKTEKLLWTIDRCQIERLNGVEEISIASQKQATATLSIMIGNPMISTNGNKLVKLRLLWIDYDIGKQSSTASAR